MPDWLATARKLAHNVAWTANLFAEECAVELYRVQAERAADPAAAALFRKLQADDATHACEARARVHAPEAVLAAVRAAARAGGGLAGTVAAAAGERASLALDLVVERLSRLGYQAVSAGLHLPFAAHDREVIERALRENGDHAELLTQRLRAGAARGH